MKRAATVIGVALLVLIVARMARAETDPRDPANWNTLPGYVPGSGYYT